MPREVKFLNFGGEEFGRILLVLGFESYKVVFLEALHLLFSSLVLTF